MEVLKGFLSAQRLSASRQESREQMVLRRARSIASAQRLSASRQESPPGEVGVAGQHLACECSTPFGIKARITRLALPTCSASLSCAQRLSASRQESLRQAWGMIQQIEGVCSTPFGIKARITSRRALCCVRSPRLVLNAFRHQGKNHSQPSSRTRASPRCAQRLSASRQESHRVARWDAVQGVLNAFRHQGKNHIAFRQAGSAGEARAQRLSASRQESQAGRCSPCDLTHVLCSTPFGIKARITLGRQPEPEIRDLECSTPFGIKARITGETLGLARPRTPVLNAFRHQGKNHLGAGPRGPGQRLSCSTPFGIKARIT